MKEFYQLYQKNPEQFQGADNVPVVEYDEQVNLINYATSKVSSIRLSDKFHLNIYSEL